MHEAERLFSDSYMKQIGSILIKSSAEEDIKEHWDFKDPIKNFTVDVKDMKSETRGKEKNEDLIVCELRNVRGNPGWMLGKADYIAFRRKDGFHMVRRIDLLKRIKEKTDWNNWGKKIEGKYERYKQIRREGRSDSFICMEYSDIRDLVRIIIAGQFSGRTQDS